MSETFTFEDGKMDHILSDLNSLILYVKDIRDKNRIEEDILDRIAVIHEQLQSAVIDSRFKG